MSLSIHLHGLQLDAQYGQLMQLRSGEMTGQWSSASLVNHTIVTNPTVRQPGFNLPWSLMNCFWTGQGPCHADLHKWGLAQSPFCYCGQRQTMNHIIHTCPKSPRVSQSRWWCSHMSGICSNCSTHEINKPPECQLLFLCETVFSLCCLFIPEENRCMKWHKSCGSYPLCYSTNSVRALKESQCAEPK